MAQRRRSARQKGLRAKVRNQVGAVGWMNDLARDLHKQKREVDPPADRPTDDEPRSLRRGG